MDNQKESDYQAKNLKKHYELQALQLKGHNITWHIRKVRDYRVDYYGRLKDGTEIIIPKQGERPSRGELSQELWDFHVEHIVFTAIGYYDLRGDSPC